VGEPLNRKRGRSGTGSAAENAECGLMVGIVFTLKLVLRVFWVEEFNSVVKMGLQAVFHVNALRSCGDLSKKFEEIE
jgi:hypothetical protein